MAEHFNTRMTLISRLRDRHDENSWNDFVIFYERYICAVITGMGVSGEDVNDLLQKVLLALWEKLPEFDYRPGDCKFRTWMRRIIRNQVCRYFEKQRRYARDSERAASKRINEDDEDFFEPEIYELAEKEWQLHVSRLAWDKVKEHFSGKVIDCYLLFAEGCSVDEVCSRLELKRNSAFVFRSRVQNLFHREIRRLDEERPHDAGLGRRMTTDRPRDQEARVVAPRGGAHRTLHAPSHAPARTAPWPNGGSQDDEVVGHSYG